jgi:hypothetical protein
VLTGDQPERRKTSVKRGTIMKTTLLAIAALALIAPPIAAHAEEAPCGVGMPVTMRSAFDKEMISDVFVADGELVEEDGHHPCIAVTIECEKKTNLCMMVDVPVKKIVGQWEIISITPRWICQYLPGTITLL